MKSLILDASAIAALFFNEPHADKAQKLLQSKSQLLAPDLILAELANIAWKRFTRNEISSSEALEILSDIQLLPLTLTPIPTLARPALELSMALNRSVYDCLYLALAIKHNAVMHTADQRFVNALTKTPVSKHVHWIGE